MLKSFVLLLVLLASGCAIPKTETQTLIVRSAKFEVHVVDILPHMQDTANAVTECSFYADDKTGEVLHIDKCKIYIKEAVYPRCLAHEIRHVFEGDWHPRGAAITDHPYYREDC